MYANNAPILSEWIRYGSQRNIIIINKQKKRKQRKLWREKRKHADERKNGNKKEAESEIKWQ